MRSLVVLWLRANQSVYLLAGLRSKRTLKDNPLQVIFHPSFSLSVHAMIFRAEGETHLFHRSALLHCTMMLIMANNEEGKDKAVKNRTSILNDPL